MQTYQDVIDSKDVDDLIAHCKYAVMDNYNTNAVDFDTWDNGIHIAETYLEDNELWLNNEDNCQGAIIVELDAWLTEMKKRPPVAIIRAASEQAWDDDANQVIGKGNDGKWAYAHIEDAGRCFEFEQNGETWEVNSSGLLDDQ